MWVPHKHSKMRCQGESGCVDALTRCVMSRVKNTNGDYEKALRAQLAPARTCSCTCTLNAPSAEVRGSTVPSSGSVAGLKGWGRIASTSASSSGSSSGTSATALAGSRSAAGSSCLGAARGCPASSPPPPPPPRACSCLRCSAARPAPASTEGSGCRVGIRHAARASAAGSGAPSMWSGWTTTLSRQPTVCAASSSAWLGVGVGVGVGAGAGAGLELGLG